MSFAITPGIPEAELPVWLEKAASTYGTFPDGRVDYSKADKAPIVMCVITCKDEVLLLKRGHGLADAEGYWSSVNGFIDEIKPVRKQVRQEVLEELGLAIPVNAIKVGKSYTLSNPQEKRRYIVFPCRVSLEKKPVIQLDREHTDYIWITRDQLEQFTILDDLPYLFDTALNL